MIRFANHEDIPRIMRFINEHWKKDHILSRDSRLFEFQHCWGKEVSFVLSENEQGKIDGVLGYIPYDVKERDVMLALWKALKSTDSMLGIKILRFLQQDPSVKTISAPGINPKTQPIYRFLGLHTGKMRHWYRLSRDEEYKIAFIRDAEIPAGIKSRNDAIVAEYDRFSQLVSEFQIENYLRYENRPYKSMDYIERRYFQHPVFQYRKYGIKCGRRHLLLIFRVQHFNGSNCLRLVDGIGDLELLPYFTNTIDKTMISLKCEYVDIYETGIEKEFMLSGGWKLTEESDNVIPEYFAPFEQRNIDIYYMSAIPNVVLFKGDGDMDRPN